MRRAEAESLIRTQIRKASELLELPIENEPDLGQAQNERAKWSDFNEELLRRIVDTNELVNSYHPKFATLWWGPQPFDQRVSDFRSSIRSRIVSLESVLSRLELIPEPSHPATATPHAEPDVSNRVFVVHGHDEEDKQSVARCIEKLGFKAVILHEQPNQGRTIIEKFEDYSDVAFAVVLLTPDDVGASKDPEGELRPRARQNVILELGFFLGELGRGRVCALHKGEVEIPSDYRGVLWVPMDEGGAWRLDLATEMKAAGLDLDLNRLAEV